jgi:hypothetical protein
MTDGDHESRRRSSVASSYLDVDHDAHVIADLEESEPQLHVVSSKEPIVVRGIS